MKLNLWKTVCILAGAILSMSVLAADVVVIVNKENTNAIDKMLVAKIYTGETRFWANGGTVLAIDQSEENPIRANFYSSMLGKNASNMKALWAQKIFSGRALPPKVVDLDSEVKKLVSNNRNAIGYIKASSADDTVKVVVK